ncbi:MAG: hypothetical protein AAFW97_04200 [Pseudomonadota bacterium]|jgi:hypothetical protein
MKVSLAPSFTPVKEEATQKMGPSLLDAAGPKFVLGWEDDALVAPNVPSASVLFGPRGAVRLRDGSFWVSDTGHHRLLGWSQGISRDNQPADILIGQQAFDREGRNAKGAATAATLNVPTGIARWGDGLAVADAWNHRVLLWRKTPRSHNQPADIILGQENAHSVLANSGLDTPRSTTMHWPYGVSEVAGRLVVCDTGNRRVLIWDDPSFTGQSADLVLGQTGFECRDENSGEGVSAAGMRWPHMAQLWQGGLAVTDAGNNRIMLWDDFPTANGQPCVAVLGQRNFTDCDHNLAAYYPSNAALNMPYAICSYGDKLIAADTANSRIVAWEERRTGSEAAWLTGQPDFASKGDNRWGFATRDSFCWPYGLTVSDREIVIADSGNNRVLVWEAIC